MSLSRRTFLRAAGAAGVLTAAGATSRYPASLAAPSSPVPPPPSSSGIDHVVVLCMENRSFDHFLGWVPGADGRQAGLAYADDHGRLRATHRLDDWTGCGFNDPDHSYEGGRVQFDDGRCDGFRRGSNDDFALGYYTEADLPVTASLVHNFTVCDRWFCSILGPTYPNRLYTHSAATDRISNTSDVSTMPTIWDRLVAAGVPATYYFSDLPVLALYGTKYADLARPFESFFAQAASGTLPAYSYLDPSFLGEDQGGSNDDHPHADIRRGQALIARVADALTTSPLWERSLLVVTYDEWGGFFDHVVPPRFPDELDRPHATPDHGQAGFRVPTYIVSPFAPVARVAHDVFDHTSILKLVEWRFGLRPLTRRDAAARNLATVLDFRAPNRRPPVIPRVPDPGPHVCGTPNGMPNQEPFWLDLRESRQMRAWEWVA